jgi:hypothetical protein
MCLEICCDWLFNPFRWTPVVNTTYTTAYPDVYTRPIVTTPVRIVSNPILSPHLVASRFQAPVYVGTTPRRDFVVSRNPLPRVVNQRPVAFPAAHRSSTPLVNGHVLPGSGYNRPTSQARVIPGSGRSVRGR